jgi:serine/threonine protein kinase
VVQHVTTRDTPLNKQTVLKAGTLVALKLFRVLDDGQGSKGKSEDRTAVYQSILKELRVLSEPGLRDHENICQWLFVCWIDDSPVPALALELAAFGSLEDVLIAEGYGLSHLQKVSITVDIALGLATIHACNFVHGDLKPGNIVLCRHETRQVVAKITDFGGSEVIESCDIDTLPSGPALATPAWCAPEVAYPEKSVDWQKADSYAFGLIVASIWCRPEQFMSSRPSSCILDFMLALDMDSDEKQDAFLLLKSQPDTSQNSVVSICCQWIRCLDRNVHDLLCSIVRGSLRRDAAERFSVGSILRTDVQGLSDHTPGQSRFVKLCLKWKSTLLRSPTYRKCDVPSREKSDIVNDEIRATQHTRFKVWGDAYSERSEAFQKLWFDMAVVELQGFDCILALPTPKITESHDPAVGQTMANDFLTLLMSKLIHYARRLEEKHLVVVRHLSRLAFQVAFCYYNRLGTLPDEVAALKWLQVSAISGNSNALALVSIVCGPPASTGFTEQQSRIGEVLAATGVLLTVSAGKGTSFSRSRSLEIFKKKHPSAYRQVVNVINWKESPRHTSSSGGYGIESISAWLDAKPFQQTRPTMRMALTHGNAQLAHALLDSDEDFSAIDEDGFGLMYYLIFLEDIDAARLAPHIFRKGAKLDLPCHMTDEDAVDGSVLCCAIRGGMVNLVMAVLNLHEEQDIQIVHDTWVLMMAITMHDPRTLYVMWTLAERKPRLSPHITRLRSRKDRIQLLHSKFHDHEEGFLTASSDASYENFDYDELIPGAMSEKCSVNMFRRSNNMEYPTTAKWVTVSLLLSLRTTFRRVSHLEEDPVLKWALKQDDHVVLTLLTSATKLSGERLDGILQLTIVSGAPLCFRAIVRFIADKPALLCALSPTHTDMTALQIAVRAEDPRYTQQLLHHGANPTHEYLRPESGVLWSALARALISGRVANAEALYAHYTAQQRENLWRAQRVGVTLVALILGQWMAMRNPLLFESLRWLASKDSKRGAYFYTGNGTAKPSPAWYSLVCVPVALRQSDRLLDKRMMMLLVEIFPKRSNRLEKDVAPIHYACLFGQLEIVEVLVSDGADVNLETGPGSPGPGMTAFDFCVGRVNNVPQGIKRAGGTAVNFWTLRVKALMSYLISAGGTYGSRCSKNTMAFWHSMSLENVSATFLSTGSGAIEDLDWPRPLPNDRSSHDSHESVKAVVRLPDMTQLSVNRAPAMLLYANISQRLEKPSDALRAWLKSEGNRYRRINRESRWTDDVEGCLDLQAHLGNAFKVRGDDYEYPELDLSSIGRGLVTLIGDISDPKNLKYLKEVEAVLRLMRFAPTGDPPGERRSNWRFAGR